MAKVNLEVTISAKQQTKLERRLVRENARRAAVAAQSAALPGLNPPPFVPYATVVEWLSAEADNMVSSIVTNHDREERQEKELAMASATPEQQAQIDAILGLT